jgi:HEPN domain-containing protein
MERKSNELVQHLRDELKHVVAILSERYQPERIFCFGHIMEHNASSGCFRDLIDQVSHHYFFLMVTSETPRKESEIQDYINTHVPELKITIIVHGKASVERAICQGNSFFIDVYRAGTVLHQKPDVSPVLNCPILNPKKHAIKRENYFLDYYDIATGFLTAADHCCDRGYFKNALFMLHQTVEHTCIALIRLFTGYRPATHSLTKSLNLCRCFSDEPAAFFSCRTGEEKRLFELLSKGYSDARYADKFDINEDDVSKLRLQLRDFLSLVRTMSYAKIEELKLAAELS